jgi:hypothetical protein
VLTALPCLALEDRPLFLTEATRILFQQLSPASRALVGVPGTTTTTEHAFKAAYRRVRYCFAAIRSVSHAPAQPAPPQQAHGPPWPGQTDTNATVRPRPYTENEVTATVLSVRNQQFCR